MPRGLCRIDRGQKLGSGMTADSARTPFDPRLIAAVVIVGVIGFIAMWALIALGPQLSAGNNGQGHALSRSVAGYAGIIDLAERSDMWVDVRRELVEATPLAEDEGRTLLVLTPEHDSDPKEIEALVKAHGDEPVLLVLPKWQLSAHETRKGWAGGGFATRAHPRLIPWAKFGGKEPDIAIVAVKDSGQVALNGSGDSRGFTMLRRGEWQIVFGGGGNVMIPLPSGLSNPDSPAARATENPALLIRSANRQLYILSEPDLINNFAFASRESARTALAVLDLVAEDADAGGVAFDVTLNGLGSGTSFLRLAFVPPFIGITLCLIAAGILALWQAAVRFGPPRSVARAIPISKLALIESSAELVAQTQRESDAAAPWLRGQREALARGLHAPPGLAGEALDQWIDRRRRGGGDSDTFAALARRLLLARTNDELLGTARQLHAIRKDLLREH
jgi:hypothetical protein